jgi:hypothetical protein
MSKPSEPHMSPTHSVAMRVSTPGCACDGRSLDRSGGLHREMPMSMWLRLDSVFLLHAAAPLTCLPAPGSASTRVRPTETGLPGSRWTGWSLSAVQHRNRASSQNTCIVSAQFMEGPMSMQWMWRC